MLDPAKILEYDEHFQNSTEQYLSNYYGDDWQLLKAQGIAESNLDPNAESPVGAQGIMQFMPVTWTEVSEKLGLGTDPSNAEENILAGGYYMRQMLRVWTSERTQADRRRWAWSSYNWGAGNVLKAQKSAGGGNDWDSVKSYLPHETQTYVARIERYHARLIDETNEVNNENSTDQNMGHRQ